MKTYKILIKAFAIEQFHINSLLHPSSKKERLKYIGFALLILYAIGVCILTASLYASFLGKSLYQINAIHLLPLLGAVTVGMIMTFFSTYSIYGILFTAKDYHLLLALPIKHRAILICKLFFSYLINFLIAICIFSPFVIVYCKYSSFSVLTLIFLTIVLIVFPLIPMSIATLFAYIIAKFSAHSKKNEQLVSLVLMILLTTGIFVLFLLAQQMLHFLLTHIEYIGFIFKKYVPLLAYLNEALISENLIALLMYLAWCLIPSFIVLLILGKSFKAWIGHFGESYQKGKYTFKLTSTKTQLKALYGKEIKRYFASSIYVINTSICSLIATLAAIASLFIDSKQLIALLEMPFIETHLVACLIAFLSMTTLLCFTSAVSISMEGKSLWIIKTLPIKTETIFKAKILVNLTMTLPFILIDTCLFALSFKLDLLSSFYLLLIPSLYALFIAQSGLLINLYYPSFNWTTETAVVKQSASSLIVLLVGIAMSFLPIGIYILLMPSNPYLFFTGLIIILLLLNLICKKLLNTKGVSRFTKIS